MEPEYKIMDTDQEQSLLYLGMLIFSLLMLLMTLLVRLKMESLSGLTDLVVSTTNVRGGLSSSPCPLLFCGPDMGHT